MEELINKIVLAVTVGLQLTVLIILIRRQLLRRFLLFSVYIGYELVQDSLRLSVAGNKSLYFVVYWITAGSSLVFTVLAVGESFLNVFRLHTRLRWFTRTVWTCVGLALLYASLKAWLFPPVNRGWKTAAVIGSEVAVEYSISAVVIVYFVFRWIFRIRGQEWESGVMVGFGIFECLALGGFLTRSIFGTKYRIVSEWLPAVAYILGEVTWVLELRRDEPEERPPEEDLTVDYMKNMDDYIKALGRIFRRKA